MQDFTPTMRARLGRPTFQFFKNVTLAFCLLIFGQYSYACSSSGFNIDDVIANPDGTYTVTMTIDVSGPNDTGLSTWGFWFDANNPVLSVSPPSLTSANGTTIFAVITGDIVTWGDPTGGTGTPFLEVPGPYGTQSFTVTLVLANIIGDWEGGGQEGNSCPGAVGTNPNDYMGPWPCPTPAAPTVIVPPKNCPGQIIDLTAITGSPFDVVTWNPPGISGPTVQVSFDQTTTIEVTVTNGCLEETTIPVTIPILSLPSISAAQTNIESCEGAPAVLEVSYYNECGTPELPIWSEGDPGIGGFNIVNPTNNPHTVTATVTNPCGEETIEFTIDVIPIPSVEILNEEEEAICLGDEIDLESIGSGDVFWDPDGQFGENITVSPTTTTTYTATVSNSCGTVSDEITIVVNEDVDEEINLEACENSFAEYEGQLLDPGSVTDFVFAAFNGCDSTVTVIVDELPTYTSQVDLEACEGTSIFYNGFELFPGSFTEITLTAFNTCDSVVSVTVNELQNYTVQVDIPTCENSFAEYEGQELDPNSVNEFQYIAFNGCDSFVTVFVPVLPTSESDLNLEACTGSTVEYNGLQLQPGTSSSFTFENYAGCDSVVNVSVTELQSIETDENFETCPGTTINYNGQQLSPGSETDFTFTTAAGCDSTVTVSVTELPEFTGDVQLEACTGTTVMYNGQELQPGSMTDFTLQAANSCDSVVTVMVEELATFRDTLMLGTCSGTTIPYAGEDLGPNTTTDFTFSAVNTCDSVVTVIVEELQILSSDLTLQTCPNSTINYNGTDYAVGDEDDVFFTATNGCDSMVHVLIEALPEFASDLNLEACTGSNATYQGQNLAPGSVTAFTFPAFNGCDSVVTVSVTELDAFTSDLEILTCPGEAVDYNGQTLQPGSITDVTFISTGGCDSIVTVEIKELAISNVPVEFETCTGSTFLYGGTELMPNTVTDFVFADQNGCDSTVTVTVNELPTYAEAESFEACIGSTITYNGQELAAGTVTDVMFMTQGGCDSVVTVTVVEVTDYTSEENLETCVGSTVTYNGQELPAGLTTQFLFTAQNGCDSVVTVSVAELDAFTSDLTLEACPNSSVFYNGTELFPGTQVPFTLVASNGCDSVVTVFTEELPTFTGDVQLSACPGGTANYGGFDLDVGTTTPFTLTAINGCDSVVTVTVLELETFTDNVQLEACPGEFATYNGQDILAGTMVDVTFSALNGCDSVVTVMVDELETFASQLTLQACIGTFAVYNGQNIPAGTTTDVQLVAQNGCDSIVTVTVDELPFLTSELNLQECQGVPVIYQGTEITPGTSMDFTFTGSTGCDSIVTVNALPPLPPSQTEEDLTICSGETATIFGQVVSTPGPYSGTFSNADGCDSIHTVHLFIQEEMTLSGVAENSCQDVNTGIIDLSVSGSDGPYSYMWNNSDNTPIIENLPSGNYSVTVTDGMGCTSISDFSVGNFDLDFTTQSELDCFGSSNGFITVDATGNNISYSLGGSDYSNNPLFTGLSSGQYEVYVQDEHSCIYSETVNLIDPAEVIVAFNEEELTIELGETITLQPIIVVNGVPTISWENTETLSCPDCENPTASPTETNIYTITIMDDKGCTAVDDILIRVNKNRDVYIPNGFSPNGDGVNDFFTIYGKEEQITKVHTFQVFSRWGEPVFLARQDFEINKGNHGWDGTHRGEELNAAVFVYFVEVEFIDGTIELFKGDVTLTK